MVVLSSSDQTGNIATYFQLTHYTDNEMHWHTPSKGEIKVDPFSVVGSKHCLQKVVNEDSFTECPGEGGQEEVVQQGCHKLAGTLYNKWKVIMQLLHSTG